MTRLVGLASRVLLGGTFAWAAATKLPDLRAFAEEVANYQLLPPALVPLAAVAFVGLELVVGLALMSGRLVRAASALSAGLLAAFIVALSQALVRGIDLRCGCFGGADLATWGTVGRDVALLGLAGLSWRWGAPRKLGLSG